DLPTDDPQGGRAGGYAPTEFAREVDEYAMAVGLAVASTQWPEKTAHRQPHNNPGFDILVGSPDDPTRRYVEIKATSMPYPRFYLTSGELEFSLAEAYRYTLLVIHSINLVGRTHEIFRHDGPVTGASFTMSPKQSYCEPVQ